MPLATLSRSTPELHSDAIEFATRRALRAALPDDVHDLLIAVTLQRVGAASIPTSPEEADHFLHVALPATVSEMFSRETAERVVAELAAAGPVAGSERARPQSPGPRGLASLDPPEGSSSVPQPHPGGHVDSRISGVTIRAPQDARRSVVLISRAFDTWAALEATLGDELQVLGTSNVAGARDALRRRPGPVVLTVDCRATVPAELLKTLLPDLPKGSQVVLWGSSAQAQALLVNLDSACEQWHHRDGGTSLGELADLIRGLSA